MSDTDITNYPLFWPKNQPRSDKRRQGRFSTRGRRDYMGSWTPSRKHSIAESARELDAEIRRMGGRGMIISSNLKVKGNGLPYSNQGRIDDPGVAVYFEWKKRDLVFACDSWLAVEDNLWAIVKHIEALRGQERWGVGSLDQAFAGYAALPDPGKRKWWEVFGLHPESLHPDIVAKYRELAKMYHPDNPTTGNADNFRQVQTAYEEFQKERGL